MKLGGLCDTKWNANFWHTSCCCVLSEKISNSRLTKNRECDLLMAGGRGEAKLGGESDTLDTDASG